MTHAGQRGKLHRARYRRPPDQYRHRPRRAADDDVLGGGALQQQRIDKHVEQQPGCGQHRSEQIGEGPQPSEAGEAEDRPEHQGRLRPNAAGGQRPAPSANHDTVDVAVDHLVDGVGAPRRHRATAESGERQPTARPCISGDHHRGHSGYE